MDGLPSSALYNIGFAASCFYEIIKSFTREKKDTEALLEFELTDPNQISLIELYPYIHRNESVSLNTHTRISTETVILYKSPKGNFVTE